MKIPNATQITVPQAKVVDYLLSDSHSVGRHKATFFRSFGFDAENWQELASALRNHALEFDITKEEPSPFGRRWIVEGIMEMPDGRLPLVRTVWFLRSEESIPRFVTAYPLKQRNTRDSK